MNTRDSHSTIGGATRTAALYAGTYVMFCSGYIWLSGRIAARISTSVESLAVIERVKGIAFIVLTGLLFFVLCRRLLGRIRRTQEQLLRQRDALMASERRAMAGTFAASTAHDMKNVVHVLNAASQVQERAGAVPPDTQRSAVLTQHALDELTRLSQRLMDIGREEMPGEFTDVAIDDVIAETLVLCQAHRSVKNCDLHAPAPTGAHLQGNPLAIQNMLFNLVLNAGQATGGRGRIDVRVESSAEAVTLAVHDDGPGVPDEKVRRVFDAFYSTRGEGHGLGLVAVTACAELHGGSVRVERSDLGGACFEVELPLDRNGNEGRRNRTLPAFTS